MLITKTVEPGHDWTMPLGLLSDCHRRVEKFLGVIARVAESGNGGPLDEEARAALRKALTYFRQAAPLHTADEEVSLFPRMRAVETDEAREAMAQIDALEADHRDADPAHAQIDALGERWLNEGSLPPADAAHLCDMAHGLQAHYRRHIDLEDNAIFPLAARVLDEATLLQVGREMAERRGVDPDAPTPVSRCVTRRAERQG